jgi:hypothetical protein
VAFFYGKCLMRLMSEQKIVLQIHCALALCIFLVFPLSVQGCVMHDQGAAEKQLIQQILLKPGRGVILNSNHELSTGYLTVLQSLISTDVQLSYVRAMSGGVHVLAIEPALEPDAAIALSAQLSANDTVEYAEPDFPRGRR